MQAAGHKTVRLWILAAYLLVTAAAGLFHLHGPRRDRPAGWVAACTGHLFPCHEQDARSRVSPDGAARCVRLHDDCTFSGAAEEGCPVCQFLAEKPVPAGRAEVAIGALLCREPACIAPVRQVQDVPSAYQGRGPPALA